MTDEEERKWIETKWAELVAEPEPTHQIITIQALCQVLERRREMRRECLEWALRQWSAHPVDEQVEAALQYYEFIRS